MKFFRNSLLLKLIMAFWLVSMAGIVIVAILAGRVSQLEFTRFANDIRYQGLVDKLGSYYLEHNNFTGAGYLLEQAQVSPNGQIREYLVVDPEGNILLSLAQHIPPGMPSPDFIRFGFPIEINGHNAAYLIPLRMPHAQFDLGSDNLKRINLNLLLGVLVALVIALIFGWVMARNIIRPLSHLNAAAQAIAQGDLDKTVNIDSNDEIGALAASFNQMIASLKRSRGLRRQMTADIAHELRNPLSIILGNAEALSDGVLPATPEALDIIYDEARHLSRLVDDLRTLSLSESGELHLQYTPVQPMDLLERCTAAYANRAGEMKISIRYKAGEQLPTLNADFERIIQVLANLLDNALKHTPPGGSILLSAVPVSQEGLPSQGSAWVEFSVEDSGSGINPEDLPFVFERFYRGKKSPGRIQDGSGLGLSISRALVELHGGHINASSEPGKGTKISFTLPDAGKGVEES